MNGPQRMGGADIHAFGPPPGPSTVRRRRGWPRVLLAALALTTLLALLAGWITFELLQLVLQSQDGWEVTIDGRRLMPHEFGPAEALLAGAGVLAALLIVLTVVPLALGLGLLGAALGLGVALLALAAVLAVVFAPLGLIALLLWLALRN